MKAKKYLLFILIIISSCSYYIMPNYIKNGFAFCYDSHETGLDSLINIEGYFSTKYEMLKNGGKIDSSHHYFMFYNDGTFVTNVHDLNIERLRNHKTNIIEYFREVVEDKKGDIKSSFYKAFDWGIYRVDGNIIKVQYIIRPIVGESSTMWFAWEIWYKIIDRNTIIEIDSKRLNYTNQSDIENYEKAKKEKIVSSATFIPLGVRPVPDSWLKKEPWFWCKNRK